MDIRSLEYFQAVCEKKSITRAAAALYMTPQGLSKTIKSLESELGVLLFQRESGGLVLTEAGHYLYDHLDSILGSYQSVCSELRCIEQRRSHEIDLLSAYGVLRLLTPDCLSEFSKAHPDIRLHYREFPDREVERHFMNGEGNAAFMVGSGGPRLMNATAMEKFSVLLLVNRHHPLAGRSSVRIEDLKDEPMYLENPEFNIHHLITGKCEQAGFSPNIVFATSGFSLCHRMVRKNKGISVTLDFMAADMGSDEMVTIPFEDEDMYWETYMLTRGGEQATPDVALFRDFVMDWMHRIKSGEIER